ncbi:WD40 repeat protein [Malassezia equina]|uniref:WD40 repeat protein n=1 Tax=Malassezia equina TaxID=1381935 RepID=A0AAF0EID5_9BASI|nr:WD40 repeat protein [Malassezia equina]
MYWPSGSARRLSAAPAGLPDVPDVWLLLTRTALLVWRTRPAELIAVVERTPRGLAQHGENVRAVWRHDAGAISVQTTRDALLFYDVVQPAESPVVHALSRADAPDLAPSMTALLATFQPDVGDAIHTPSGDPLGPRCALHVSLRHALHVDPGIAAIAPVGPHLLVATRTPAAVQLLPWPGLPESNETQPPVLLRDVPWLGDAPIVQAEHSYATDLSAWLTSDGCAYVVSLTNEWRGALAYQDRAAPVATAVNARFSLLALGLDDGRIALYEFQTSTQTPLRTHELALPRTLGESGTVHSLSWTPDGHALAVGWAHGWALWSPFGRLLAHSFRDDWASTTRIFRDTFAFGVKSVFWGLSGTDLFLLPTDARDAWVHVLPFVKAASTLHMTPQEAGAALLLNNDSVYVYRGLEQSDAGLLAPDSDAWRRIALPPSYATTQWPLHYATLSADGRFLAVAGRRGLAHYSTSSGHWKCYENAAQAQAFRVRGGLAWFQHVLIAACDCQGEVQVRLYSRDQPLDNAHLLDLCVLSAPVITLQLFGANLLVYLADNTLVHYVVTTTATRIRLQLCGSISFDGIIGEPARVRAFSWRPSPHHVLQDDLAQASLLFLIDGMLVLLRPVRAHDADELSYDLHILHEHIEAYWMNAQAQGPWPYSLWGLDGSHMRVWLDPKAPPLRLALPDEAYPLCVLLDRGLILDAESVSSVRRTLDTVSFRVRLHTTLFLDSVIRTWLQEQGVDEAVDAAAPYASLTYFPHVLERLLAAVLEEEADARPPLPVSEQCLPTVAAFLDHYACSVAVVARAARKTEATRWPHLFACVGAPRTLLAHAVRTRDWDTACALLLVVHTLDEEASSIAATSTALARMEQDHAWDSIRQVLSFLATMDEHACHMRACLAAAAHEAPQSVFVAWLEAASDARVASTLPAKQAPLAPAPVTSTEVKPRGPASPRKAGLGDGPRRPSRAARLEGADDSRLAESRASPAEVLHRAARHASLTLSPSITRMQANGRVVVGPATPGAAPSPRAA